MDSLKWPLFFVCLCFKVTQNWEVTFPSTVEGLLGYCVVIPCSYDYPNTDKITGYKGIWYDDTDQRIYHPDEAQMKKDYLGRTQLPGDLAQKNCSLKIDPLQASDKGPFRFRIELQGYNMYTYRTNAVSISLINEPKPINFSVKNEPVENQDLSVSCSVSHSCPASPPSFNWNHSGEIHSQQQKLKDGQWKETSTLTFRPTSADHNKSLQCTVTYKGTHPHSKSEVLKVKYGPENVTVDYKPDVKEGEDVQLKCSGDAHPAPSYKWHNEIGAQLHQGNIFVLPNVSRHNRGALYCTVENSIRQVNSSSVQLNVLYGPEIKTTSSCFSEADMVKCECNVESNPPSTVNFVLSDRVLSSTSVKNHDSVTTGTLQAELRAYKFVSCLANNTQGNANLTLALPAHSEMQSLYIFIAIGAGVTLLILLIAVGVVTKCRGRSGDAPTSNMDTLKAGKDVELSQYVTTTRKMNNDDEHCSAIYSNEPVYGNMVVDEDDAIYANM